jgi:hypothetical protein
MMISRWILLRMRNISDKVVEKIKTRILCWITCSSVYDIKWKNMVEADDVTIWQIRVACWISKATWTHERAHAQYTHIYVIFIAFPREQWFTNAPWCCSIHCLSCLYSLNNWTIYSSIFCYMFIRQSCFHPRTKQLFCLETLVISCVKLWLKDACFVS